METVNKETIEVFEIDDDFDPLEDTGLELEEDAEYAGGLEYQVPIPDADRSIVPPKVELSAPERIAKLIDGLPGQKFRLLTAIRICQEAKTLEEAASALEEQYPQGTSVYSAARLIELLTEAGALDCIEPEGVAGAEGGTDMAGADGADSAAGVASTAGAAVVADAAGIAGSADLSANSAEKNDVKTCSLTSPDEETERIDTISLDDLNLEYDEVEELTPCTYVATADGLCAIEERWGTSVAKKAVLAEPQYFPIWKKILEMCAQEGGKSKKAIEVEIDGDPLVQEPRRYCQYFIEKLKEAGAVEWKDAWVITEIGKELLAGDIFPEQTLKALFKQKKIEGFSNKTKDAFYIERT